MKIKNVLMIMVALAAIGYVATQADAQGYPGRHVCHGFTYKTAHVHDLIAYDVPCKTATPLAKRYYDVAKLSKRDGFTVSGPWRGYVGANWPRQTVTVDPAGWW
jgi:hypothetical protein